MTDTKTAAAPVVNAAGREVPDRVNGAPAVPYRGVGGDYYEIFDDEDTGDLEFAIGDVSGKGVPAALLMSTLQSAFLGISSSGDDLARVCERLNKFLNARTSPERYATFSSAG